MGQESVRVFKLHPAQLAIWNSKARFKIAAAGRRFGKSYLAAVALGAEALKDRNERGYALTAEHGVYYISPTFDQAKRNMWRRLRLLLGYEKQGGVIKGENINDGYFELVNGRRIYIKGADNEDSLRGEGYSFVVLDEYADMKASVFDDIIDPALMDVEGSVLFIGTPKGKNHFYKKFMAALTLDDNGVPLAGKDWEAFHFKSNDNPFLKASEVARIRNDPNKSKDTIRQELDASFISGGSRILSPDRFPIIPNPHGNKYRSKGSVIITVDLAGFEPSGNKIEKNDSTVICVTDVVEDTWTVMDMIHGQWGVRETALFIVSAIRDYPNSRLGIEAGALKNAVGPYMEEYMRTFGRFVTVEPLLHGNQRKYDRIVWALQGRTERGKIRLVEGDWTDWFLDQVSDFPDPLAHDDGLDALAYCDQLAKANFMEADDVPEWEPLDLEAGY